MSRGYPYRARRCHCGRMAVTINDFGKPVCAKHIYRNHWQEMVDKHKEQLITVIGKEDYDIWWEREIVDDDAIQTWKDMDEKIVSYLNSIMSQEVLK